MQNLAHEIEVYPWIFLGATAMPLYITIYPPLYTIGFQEKFGAGVELIYASENNRAHWYMRADQLDALAEKVLPMLLKEKWQWYERCIRELAEFQVFNQKFLAMSLSKLSDSEVIAVMREYRTAFTEPFTTNNVIEALSYYFQHRLKDMLTSEGLSKDRIDALMEKYGQSAKPNYVKECAESYRRAANAEERELVRRKYYYIFNDYMGPHETTHEELQKLAESTPYVFAEAYSAEDGISERAQALLIVFQVVATVQDVRKAELLEMVTAAKRFGEECARRANVSYEDIEYATWDEIETSSWKLEDLRARRKPFVMHWSLTYSHIYQEAEAAKLIEDAHRYILKVDADAKEVKGICASKGKVVGRAVVIFEPKEFDRVRAGDVLFTMMTRPEFLPVMYKAAAFVCDEGGLTSHAAIVAREMGKPCVVATRTGTRVFKDGDMVEVDAEKGIVRKVEG